MKRLNKEESAIWREFLSNPAHQDQGPFVACDAHSMGSTDPLWTCWMCAVGAPNLGCRIGCTAGTDMYYCTEAPPGRDCACKCHATGDLDVW